MKSPENEILHARREIDKTTYELVRLIKRRDEAARRIARAKKSLGICIVDRKRERLVLERARKIALSRRVDAALVESIIRTLISHSRKLQQEA